MRMKDGQTDSQRQTGTDRDRQRQTETDRDRQTVRAVLLRPDQISQLQTRNDRII